MKASLATVVLSSAALATAQTNFTGDTLQGYPVIYSLDIADTPANTISRYWLSAAESQGGIQNFIPVFVARGSNDSVSAGRKLSLSASIHGDELNGIPVVQRVFSRLRTAIASGNFNGTVVGIPTLNPNGNLHNNRNFWSSTPLFLTNLNRVFPGESRLEGAAIGSAYAYNIWNNIWGNTSNVDVAVDLHTLATGANGPLWAYADFRLDGVQRLAELAQPDIIKIDPGEPGSVETTFVDNGVPAITLEIGPAKNWNQTLIRRSEDFIFRLLEDLRVMPAGNGSNAESGGVQVDLSQTFKAINVTSASVYSSGWLEMNVQPLDDVEEGQQVGVLYNSWGDVIQNVTAPVTGRVLTVRTDPAVEQGLSVLDVVYNATSTL